MENEYRKVCSWCNKDLGPAPGCPGDSHGICPECADKVIADFESTPPGQDTARLNRHRGVDMVAKPNTGSHYNERQMGVATNLRQIGRVPVQREMNRGRDA